MDKRLFQPLQTVCTDLGSQHQHQIVPVGELSHKSLVMQKLCQFFTGIAVGLGLDGDFQRLAAIQYVPVLLQPRFQCIDLVDEGIQPLRQRLHVVIGRVQRLKDEVGGAGGAEEHHGVFRLLPYGGIHLLGKVQIGAARQHRQRLVSRITADIGTQVDGVQRGGEELQIRAVSIVHRQQYAVLVAYLCQCSDIRTAAQIVGAGEIYGGRQRCGVGKIVLQLLRRQIAGEIAAIFGRVEPVHLQIQQCRGT